MTTVADLVEEEALAKLASDADLRQGVAWADEDRVDVDGWSPAAVTATVADGEERAVVLRSSSDGLEWSCACGATTGERFCAHCVAAATQAWRMAPNR